MSWDATRGSTRPAPSSRVEDALKLAVAAGTASTLEVGAGMFDPRDAGRMVSAVEVVELAPVS